MNPTVTALPKTPLKLSKDTPVHLVGIGGVGMSGLAQILLDAGFKVSGSDASENPRITYLREQGATIPSNGHHRDNVPEGALLVLSSAIKPENPEWTIAREKNLAICHRSDLLREILEGQAVGYHHTVGLTGTHGKTTMTGMTGLALQAAGLDPTVIAGGKIPGEPANVIIGKGRNVAVAEMDESDGTVVAYNPTITVIANLELDHADHYQDGLKEILKTFETFVGNLQPTERETLPKSVILNVDCPNTATLWDKIPAHIQRIPVSYEKENISGIEPAYWLEEISVSQGNGCYGGNVMQRGDNGPVLLGRLQLQVPGWHNLLNALLSCVVGDLMGAQFEPMAKALSEFTGMGRRFEVVGYYNGARLVDDYAHHPTEVRATLKAGAEKLGPRGVLTAIFQPHRYSRLAALWEEFVLSFVQADFLYITDVYAAGEEAMPGISGKDFVAAIAAEGVLRPDKIRYIPRDEWDRIYTELAGQLKPADLVVTLGAGDVTKLLRQFPGASATAGESMK